MRLKRWQVLEAETKLMVRVGVRALGPFRAPMMVQFPMRLRDRLLLTLAYFLTFPYNKSL